MGIFIIGLFLGVCYGYTMHALSHVMRKVEADGDEVDYVAVLAVFIFAPVVMTVASIGFLINKRVD